MFSWQFVSKCFAWEAPGGNRGIVTVPIPGLVPGVSFRVDHGLGKVQETLPGKATEGTAVSTPRRFTAAAIGRGWQRLLLRTALEPPAGTGERVAFFCCQASFTRTADLLKNCVNLVLQAGICRIVRTPRALIIVR
ncbi:MAG: hypothetical protein EBZ13_10820, partial [Planctomycetia bacterium]|nr:hypothetical protein [Planctomycetia bacterium]